MSDIGIAERPDDQVAVKRQAANRIRGWHHHAIRTKDMATTREFYEGILGLPLTGTWVETYDELLKKPTNYVHCFFELGDGSALAFFQFEEGMRDDPDPIPPGIFDHHLALGVDTIADVQDFERKLTAAGHQCLLIDHGYCYSVYTTDPNGMNVEVSTIVPDGPAILARAAVTADADLNAWLDGIREGNNQWRGTTKVDAA